ncbi:3-hydroxyacyl-CoA dehydrogenase NAD-binding domain-containing protein [Oscillatoria amoena NRMC-F 0135]|nr:3-hydroxyacyl-CoA dehydrogenase NAD-binding domain-containing protein [Oscillatoria amoena NRMC-F 0135]
MVENFQDFSGDLIIEAIVESLPVKQQFFKTVEEVNGPSCILTTNTSSIPITQIASVLRNPERFAGLHFF